MPIKDIFLLMETKCPMKYRQRVSFLAILVVRRHITVNKRVLSASLNKTFHSLMHISVLQLIYIHVTVGLGASRICLFRIGALLSPLSNWGPTTGSVMKFENVVEVSALIVRAPIVSTSSPALVIAPMFDTIY